MAHPLVTTLPVAVILGGLVGLAFHPWWVWSPAGAAIGAAYAVMLTVTGVRLMRWLRRGSPERRAGVTVGGGIGAVGAGISGAVAAFVLFPPESGDSSGLFAIGMVGFFAAGPVGFAAGAIAGGLLTALFEWLDVRYVTPLRAESAVVDRGTRIGLLVGLGVAVLLAALCSTNWGTRHAWLVPPGWLVATLIGLLLLGVFWVLRYTVKQRPGHLAADMTWFSAQPKYQQDLLTLALALGFTGGAVGFLVGVALHVLGVRVTPPEPEPDAAPNERRKARPGWWRKRPPRD